MSFTVIHGEREALERTLVDSLFSPSFSAAEKDQRSETLSLLAKRARLTVVDASCGPSRDEPAVPRRSA